MKIYAMRSTVIWLFSVFVVSAFAFTLYWYHHAANPETTWFSIAFALPAVLWRGELTLICWVALVSCNVELWRHADWSSVLRRQKSDEDNPNQSVADFTRQRWFLLVLSIAAALLCWHVYLRMGSAPGAGDQSFATFALGLTIVLCGASVYFRKIAVEAGVEESIAAASSLESHKVGIE